MELVEPQERHAIYKTPGALFEVTYRLFFSIERFNGLKEAN